MYPVLFRVGDFELTSFGFMVALGFLAGTWLFNRELEVRGLRHASSLALVGAAAGIAGAKLLWVAEHLGEEPSLDLLTSPRRPELVRGARRRGLRLPPRRVLP